MVISFGQLYFQIGFLIKQKAGFGWLQKSVVGLVQTGQ